MSDHLSDPPMIITNIPTNEKYLTPYTFTGYGPGNTYVTYDGDSVNKYNGGLDSEPGSLQDICLMPNSIQDSKLRHGVIATVLTYEYGTSYGGLIYCKVMTHPGGKSLSDYSSGWTEVPGTKIATGTGNFGFNVIRSIVFSQRQGEYGYCVMQIQQDYGSYNVGYKFNRGEFTQVWYQESFYLADYSPIFDFSGDFFVSDDANPFIWHIFSGSHRGLSNGDDIRQGTQVFAVIDDGSPNGNFIYIGDQTGQDPYSNSYGVYVSPGSGYHFTGKNGAYRQKYSIPAGQWGHGPFLVNPWASGSYNPPELWFFIQEYDSRGFVTGRYKIYRSQWKRGQYKRYDNPRPGAPLQYQPVIYDPTAPDGVHGIPPGGAAAYNFHSDGTDRTYEEIPFVLNDDPAFMLGAGVQGGTRYPKLNQYGYAFDHNWFNQSHYVGTVGPFSNLNMFNPKSTPMAHAQNQSYGIGTNGYYNNYDSLTDFRVIRDRKRRGVLHLVTTDGAKNVYFANSSDDGRTWSRAQQSLGPHGFNNEQYAKLGYNNSGGVIVDPIRAERLFDDHTVMALNYGVSGPSTSAVQQVGLSVDRYASGQRAALLVVDYSATGVGNADNTGAYFKRGELNRQSWL